jgi:O-antigen ligase
VLLKSNFDKLIFFKIPVFLFILLPLFLITGPFLSDLAISLISIIFLIYCWKNKNFSYFKNKYFYFFLIFYFYLVLNSIFNNSNFDSLKISIFYFRYGIFVIAITTLMKVNYKFINFFFYSIMICFISLILDGFYQYFYGVNILGWENSSRTSSFFGEEKILGSYLSRLWPIFFGLFIILNKKKNKIYFLFITIFILSEVLIFLSGDRSAFFLINLSAFFVIIFSQRLLKLRLITLLSSFFLILTITFINPVAKERVIDKTLSQMNLFNNDQNDQIYIFSKQHTHHYITAYKMFIDNKAFGVGVKNFRNFCDVKKYEVSPLSCSTHPHNTYVQILVETGIVGILFLFSVLFYFFKNMIKHVFLRLKGNSYFTDFEICILSGIVIYLWPFIPTGNFFNNWLNILLVLNLPFLIWSRQHNSR